MYWLQKAPIITRMMSSFIECLMIYRGKMVENTSSPSEQYENGCPTKNTSLRWFFTKIHLKNGTISLNKLIESRLMDQSHFWVSHSFWWSFLLLLLFLEWKICDKKTCRNINFLWINLFLFLLLFSDSLAFDISSEWEKSSWAAMRQL